MALFYPHYFRMFCVVGRSQLHHRLCFGIYDANCDGPSYENPVKIVKAAGGAALGGGFSPLCF